MKEGRNLREIYSRLRKHFILAKEAEIDQRTAAPIAKAHLKSLQKKHEDAAHHLAKQIDQHGATGNIIKVSGLTREGLDFEMMLCNISLEDAIFVMKAQAIKNPELIESTFKFEAIPLKRLIIYTNS